MQIAVDSFYKEFYEGGHLNYALSCLATQGSFEAYHEWLKTEPVAMFRNNDDYSVVDKTIYYRQGNEEEEETYPITMIIYIGEDTIFHSAEASQSMFFKIVSKTNLEALYVD